MPTCLLPGCARECFVEKGIVHDFCGRTHAIDARKLGLSRDSGFLPGSQRRCALSDCDKPVHVDVDPPRVYDYCSISHRDLAKERGEFPNRNTSANKCMFLGCPSKRYVFEDGSEMDFCGKTHALKYAELHNVNALTSQLATIHVQAPERKSDEEQDSESEDEQKAIEALGEMKKRIQKAEQNEHGKLCCARCCATLCPLNWVCTYTWVDDKGRKTTGCTLVNHHANELKVEKYPHPNREKNKQYKYRCAECKHDVGTQWDGVYFHGILLKCVDVQLVLSDGTRPPVTDWRTCRYLERITQLSHAPEGDAFAASPLDRDERYESIKKQFDISWRNTRQDKFNYHGQWTKATLTSVVEIVNQKIHGRFLSYQQSLRGSSHAKRLYHGTSRSPTCALHRGLTCQNLSTCALCSICKTGFDLRRAGAREWERFGHGIYFGPTAAKSHDYNGNGAYDEQSGERAMLLCLVELGNAKRLDEDAPEMKSPPPGFHSVHGVKQKDCENLDNNRLRFAERVVYAQEAAVVNYVLFYKFSTCDTDPSLRHKK